MYIAIRTDDGRNIGKISFYCNTLQVSRQAFYNYLERKGKPWKYQPLADAILEIHDEDEENEKSLPPVVLYPFSFRCFLM